MSATSTVLTLCIGAGGLTKTASEDLWKAGPRSAFAGIIVGLGLGPTLWFAALQERSTVFPYVADAFVSFGLVVAGVVGVVWTAFFVQFLLQRPHSRRGKLALAGVSGSFVALGLGLGFWLAYFALPFARG